jgi:multicomponent Na+:H+ antiporter subunit F
MIALVFVLLASAGLCFFIRLVIGPSLADRVVALDGLVITVVAAVTVDAARTGSPRFLDAVVVIAVVGFVGTTAAARFIEQRGG